MTELSPEAKKLFETARQGFGPDDAQLASMTESVATRLAQRSDPPAGAGGAPAAGAGSLGTGAWVGIGIALAALSSTFVVASRHAKVSEAVTARGEPRAAAVEVASGAEPKSTSAGAEFATGTSNRVEPSDTASSVARDVRHGQVRAAIVRNRPLRSAAKADEPEPERLARAEEASRDPKHDRWRQVQMNPEQQRRAAPASNTAVPQPSDSAPSTETAPSVADTLLAQEFRLVDRARVALDRHDATQALSILEQHAAAHPRGTLRQERLALRVLALCALGRTEAARAAIAELERTAPRSPHWMRIRASCSAPDGNR